MDIVCFYHTYGLVIGERVEESMSGDSVTLRHPYLVGGENGKISLVDMLAFLDTDTLVFLYDEIKMSSKGDLRPKDELRDFYMQVVSEKDKK